jgi:hypothetical protein
MITLTSSHGSGGHGIDRDTQGPGLMSYCPWRSFEGCLASTVGELAGQQIPLLTRYPRCEFGPMRADASCISSHLKNPWPLKSQRLKESHQRSDHVDHVVSAYGMLPVSPDKHHRHGHTVEQSRNQKSVHRSLM